MFGIIFREFEMAVRERFPWIHTYGCMAQSINLLVTDIEKIISVDVVISENVEFSKFFKRSIPKSILQQQQSLKVKLGCPTRWSGYYQMLKRNTEIKKSQRISVINDNCAAPNHLKLRVLDDEGFWKPTETVASLFRPVTHAISITEGDSIPISVGPEVFAHIEASISETLEDQSVLSEEESEAVMLAIESRRNFSLGSNHFAANLLDPRFRGRILTENQVVAAEDAILAIAALENLPAEEITTDLLEYRTKSGTLLDSS